MEKEIIIEICIICAFFAGAITQYIRDKRGY